MDPTDDAGSNEKLKEPTDSDEHKYSDLSQPVLLHAIRNGHYNRLATLCAQGADVNAADIHGVTPLIQCAAICPHNHYAQILLKLGADPNLMDNLQTTALSWAVNCHNEDLVRILLEHGADPNVPIRKGDPCLHIITGRTRPHSLQILRLLLENGADVDYRNNCKQTALYKAIRQNNHKHVEVLLQHGASTNVFDESNRTPLHVAVACSNPLPQQSIVQELISHGAIVNVCDRYSFTPLCLSLSSLAPNAVDIACFLIRHGAIVHDPKLLQSIYLPRNVWRLFKVLLIAGMHSEIIKVGVKKASEAQSKFCDNDDDDSILDSKDIKDLLVMCQNPLSLQYICRIAIRQEIILNTPGISILLFIDRLPLPTVLKEFLSMLDCIH